MPRAIVVCAVRCTFSKPNYSRMELYERKIFRELEQWQKKITRKPSLTNRVARSVQQRVNKIIPEKAHRGNYCSYQTNG